MNPSGNHVVGHISPTNQNQQQDETNKLLRELIEENKRLLEVIKEMYTPTIPYGMGAR